MALNDVERRALVMRAEEADHEGFAISMRRDQPKTIRVETRMTLTEFEKAVFKTGMTLRDGVTAVGRYLEQKK